MLQNAIALGPGRAPPAVGPLDLSQSHAGRALPNQLSGGPRLLYLTQVPLSDAGRPKAQSRGKAGACGSWTLTKGPREGGLLYGPSILGLLHDLGKLLTLLKPQFPHL